MQRETVDEMLTKYKEYAARVAYLDEMIRQTEHLCESLHHNVIENTVSITQVITDMPRGTTTGDPTGKLGALLADGYTPDYIKQVENDLMSMKIELRSKETVVICVNAWLLGLNPREKFVIEHKIIAGMYWREMVPLYKNEFGEDYSRQGLKRIKKYAMEKIYRIAE